jgi:hypothetical protein
MSLSKAALRKRLEKAVENDSLESTVLRILRKKDAEFKNRLNITVDTISNVGYSTGDEDVAKAVAEVSARYQGKALEIFMKIIKDAAKYNASDIEDIAVVFDKDSIYDITKRHKGSKLESVMGSIAEITTHLDDIDVIERVAEVVDRYKGDALETVLKTMVSASDQRDSDRSVKKVIEILDQDQVYQTLSKYRGKALEVATETIRRRTQEIENKDRVMEVALKFAAMLDQDMVRKAIAKYKGEDYVIEAIVSTAVLGEKSYSYSRDYKGLVKRLAETSLRYEGAELRAVMKAVKNAADWANDCSAVNSVLELTDVYKGEALKAVMGVMSRGRELITDRSHIGEFIVSRTALWLKNDIVQKVAARYKGKELRDAMNSIGKSAWTRDIYDFERVSKHHLEKE